MKEGLSLKDLAAKLDLQKRQKLDFVADTSKLHFATGNDIPSRIALQQDVATDMIKVIGGGPAILDLTPYAERQIGAHFGIPAKYWDSLRNDDNKEMRCLLANIVNTHFTQRPSKRMIRAWNRGPNDVTARAVLSNRYRRLDNDTLASIMLPALGDLGDVNVVSCDVTERKLYIKALCPRIQADVKVGDPVQAGIVISNSEIGAGSLQISPLVYRLVCSNGMITSDVMKRTHIGRRVDEGRLEIYSDDTLAADDEAFWRVARDHVKAAVDETRFLSHVAKLTDATKEEITGKPEKVVEVLQPTLKLTDDERGGVLEHLLRGGDLSKWGLANAVTRHSQDVDDYDRATELEHAGSTVIDLPAKAWRTVATAE